MRGLFRRLRDARRRKGMTQRELAEAVGCRQSAISMMENGRPGAVAEAGLRQIAKTLGIDLDASAPPVGGVSTGIPYCPVPECPSNFPYRVGDEVRLWPSADPGGGRHCRFCGEVLERTCPNPECRAPAGPGACCERCGTPRVPAPPEAEHDPARWIEHRRGEIAAFSARPGPRNAAS